MKIEASKAGCAFEVLLDHDDGDFVVVDNRDGQPTQTVRRGSVPQRLRDHHEKHSVNLHEVIAKLRHAEARRDAVHDRIRMKANAQNSRVHAAHTAKEQETYHNYWALDKKLRGADRRRENLIRHIRERAQTTSTRALAARGYMTQRREDLDARVQAALVRAADNRNAILRDLCSRLHQQNAHIERVRNERIQAQGARITDGYWEHDRKLTDAEKRREQQLNMIRQKAGSPNSKIQSIRQTELRWAKERTNEIEERMSSAELRRRENQRQIQAKASESSRKVGQIQEAINRRKKDKDTTTFERHRKALENRERHLHSVRSAQLARSMKSERVRQAKRAMVAAN